MAEWFNALVESTDSINNCVECKYCTRSILNAGGLFLHEKHCKQNPERVHRKRSPLAGNKKGCKPWNKGKRLAESDKREIPLSEVMTEHSTYARHHLRRRLISEKLLAYHCSICGLPPEWHGKPMPLILDHINGVNDDNRLSNLRFVCSNCDSQLSTYKARNIKRRNG